MTEKIQKKSKPSLLSSQPYRRRSEEEMLEIVREIQERGMPKKTACRKYGVNKILLQSI